MSAENVVFFGAGASFGSDNSGTPPLGAKLFDELCGVNHSGWGAIPADLADTFRDDFEVGMTQLNRQAAAPLLSVMAAYFYRFIPQASSLYVDFAGRIASSGGWSGAICSINYERLMELALLQKGIQPILDGPAQSPGQIELCLPHGCCHLFCESVTGMAGAVRMNPWAIKTNGPVRPLTDPAEFQQRFQREAFPPVMSFFEPSKYTTSGNAWVEQRRKQWAELVNSADTIAIVGVKYRPGDAHIWDPIAATSAKVVYCCGQNAGNDYKKWIAGNPKRANDQVLNKYFKEGYNELCTALRL